VFNDFTKNNYLRNKFIIIKMTSIYKCVLSNNILEIRKLIDKGKDINGFNGYNDCGETIIHCAINNNNFNMLKYLFIHGADILRGDRDDFTPLMLCVWNNKLKMLKYIIKRVNKNHINYLNHEGYTAFLCACISGNFEILKYLIKKGAYLYTNKFLVIKNRHNIYCNREYQTRIYCTKINILNYTKKIVFKRIKM